MTRENQTTHKRNQQNNDQGGRQSTADTGNQHGNQKGSSMRGEPGDNRGNARQDDLPAGQGKRSDKSENNR